MYEQYVLVKVGMSQRPFLYPLKVSPLVKRHQSPPVARLSSFESDLHLPGYYLLQYNQQPSPTSLSASLHDKRATNGQVRVSAQPAHSQLALRSLRVLV